MTPTQTIIAIEIGSSKVTGLAGVKHRDGKIAVVAHVQQSATTFIRKGIIYNADLAAACMRNIILRLKEQLQQDITQVYVAYSGQGIHSVVNEVSRHYDTEHKITKEDIDGLYDENITSAPEGRCILEVVPLEYSADTQKTTQPVGILTTTITGRYLNIVAKPKIMDFLEDCFKSIGIHVVEYKLTPLLVGDQLLSESQRNSGCVLVDIGADTTTVSVYKSKLLRFLAVIPLGSDNITKDLMTLQMEHSEAEDLKTGKFGEPYATFTEEEGMAIVHTTADGTPIQRRTLGDVIDARLTEILLNVKHQINESRYTRESLVAGAFLTGGGANMPNIANVFKDIVGIDKVIVRKNSLSADYILTGPIRTAESRYLAALALLASANQPCTVPLLQRSQEIFEQPTDVPDTHPAALTKKPNRWTRWWIRISDIVKED